MNIIAELIFGPSPQIWVKLFYKNIWNLRKKILSSTRKGISYRFANWLHNKYWYSYGSDISIHAKFNGIPIFPHGPSGIFVSSEAIIGNNCVIFQQVTIGSNTLKNSLRGGSPILEDNVYIGCGAKIIGKVHVGHNARIGANCVVVKDVPANSVTVIRNIESIIKGEELDNEFIPISNYVKRES